MYLETKNESKMTVSKNNEIGQRYQNVCFSCKQ